MLTCKGAGATASELGNVIFPEMISKAQVKVHPSVSLSLFLWIPPTASNTPLRTVLSASSLAFRLVVEAMVVNALEKVE